MKKILFITWDGPQTSYLEGLFLPIFKKLNEAGFSFHILQFNWGGKVRIDAIRIACEEAGCSYQLEKIYRYPVALGGVFTALKGAIAIRRAIRTRKIDIVMPRSTLPALATLLALRGKAMPMIFDADGLPLDERVDFFGQSAAGLVYRVLRDIEAQAVQSSEVVLTRSRKAVEILRARAGAGTDFNKFQVVSNGRDPALFNPSHELARLSLRKQIQVSPCSPLLVYSGSIGSQYCVTEMLAIFEIVWNKNNLARLLVLTASVDEFQTYLRCFTDKLQAAVLVRRVRSDEVPKYLAACDLGLSLRKPSFSMQGVAPIKLGEYLMCGLPVIATAGVGDADALPNDTACILKDHTASSLEAAALWFVDEVLPQREVYRARCQKTGGQFFSLAFSVNLYRQGFARLK